MRIFGLVQTAFFSKSTLIFLCLCSTGISNAAEQWGWTVEIRRGNTLIASDGIVYPNQSQAVAAMRNLNPPQSQLFTEASPGHGNPGNGSIEIEYRAPIVPLIIGEPTYTHGVHPLLFGPPPQIFNPLDVTDEADLAEAINSWHKTNNAPICESQDRNVVIEDASWGGAPTVSNKSYSYTAWSSDVSSTICFPGDETFPFDDGLTFSNVYRIREQTCPDGYFFASQEADGTGTCEILERGVVRGTPHQCEVTPISTSVGNPCDTVTGAKTETDIDYSSDTVSIVRSYNSHAQLQDSFGPGWLHNYDRRMSVSRPLFGGAPVPSMLIRSSGVTNLLRAISSNGETMWQSTSGNGLLTKAEGANYRVNLRSGGSELYDADGLLIELVDVAGRITQIDRDTNGAVSLVTGPFGKTLTFHYDSEDRLVSIDDPAGNPIVYGYGPGGELASVTYQDSTVKQYHYEDPTLPFHLTGITDENGERFATYSYDSIGRTVFSEHAGGVERFQFEYLPTQTVVTDASGTLSTYQFTTDTSRLRKLTALLEEDATTVINSPNYNSEFQRRPTSIVDPNGVMTEFAYDQYHRTQMIEAKGLPEERITQYEYLSDNSNLVTRETSPSVFPGQTKEIVVDYGSDSLPDSMTISGFTVDGDPVQRVITTTYNAFGQPLVIDGPRTDVSDVMTFAYHECVTGNECGQPQWNRNALGHTTTFDSYDAHGRVATSTDPNGVQTTISYDVRGRVVNVLESSGSFSRGMAYTYEPNGNVATIDFPSGFHLVYEYSAAQQLTAVTDNEGNRIEYTYDSRGNRTIDETKDTTGIVRRQIDRAYDFKNRLTRITSAGVNTDMTYNGRSELSNVDDFEFDYNSVGNLTNYRGLDSDTGQTFADFNFTHNASDELLSAETLNGSATSFNTDDLGNVLQENSPDRGSLTLGYDEAGNVVSSIDARGVVGTRSYDALNRPIAATFPDSSFNMQWIYDVGANGVGQLTQTIDRAATTDFSYTPFGQISAVARSVTSDSLATPEPYTTLFAYNAAGQIEKITYPSGREVSYSYDGQGRTISVASLYRGITQDVITAASYLPFGHAQSITYGNGLADSWQFDLNYRPASRTISGLYSIGYAYDDRRNITQIADNLDAGRTQSFIYGLFDELLSETGDYGTKNYTYDGNLNRLSRDFDDGMTIRTQTLAYLSNSNRIATRNGNGVTYDASGNISFDGAGSNIYSYDDTNRMSSVTKNGVVTERYRYASGGERLVRESINDAGDATNRLFEYLTPGQLLTEIKLAPNGARIERDIVWLNGAPVAQFRNRYRSDGSYRDEQLVFLHTDHLGSPRIGTNLAGAITWRWDSDAFGKGSADSDPDGDGEKVFVKLRLPGQLADSSSGKRYNYFRDYDQGLGRYLESDPIGLSGGLNTYGYVGGNPLSAIDPLGLEIKGKIFGVVFNNVNIDYLGIEGQDPMYWDDTGLFAVQGWHKWSIDALFSWKIVCTETFDDECSDQPDRTWYTAAKNRIALSPIRTAIKDSWLPFVPALTVKIDGALKARAALNEAFREKLELANPLLDAFATSVCKGTPLPDPFR